MFSVERLGQLRSLGLDRLPKSVAEKLPISGDGGFDYVLDASGYSLTDAWGLAPVNSRCSRLGRWARRGTGFAMLPQAFGPFSSPEMRSGVSKVLGYADRVWARDGASLEYLTQLNTVGPLISVAPDITITHNVGQSSSVAAGCIVLVPNWNLAARSGDDGGRSYLSALAEIASTLIARGQPVLGLSHEGKRDLELITSVAERVPGMRIVTPATGTEAKAVLAGSDLVIAGRYHALVSALSSGVPVIAHSWSHKYASLMKDFEVPDGLADPLASGPTLDRVDALDLPAERARLEAVKPTVAAQVDAVWSEVAKLLAAHGARVRG
jgi:colanic acid/amylovoran biosynthesis protein